MKQLQDKWAEIESLAVHEAIPDREDIEQMIGLTGKQNAKKSLHEMMKNRSKEESQIEEANAKQFIKGLKMQKLERKQIIHLINKKKLL